VDYFIEGCFSWPSYPATVFLLLVCAYWVLVMIGALDLEFLDLGFLDFDLDADIDTDVSILQFGFVPLKWMNLGSVPTMLWVSVFSLAAWMTSRLFDSPAPHATFAWLTDGQSIVRDIGIALFVTKCVTQPLRGRFDPVEPNKASDLIGSTCLVSTSEVTKTFGEAEYSTDGAPLKLTVRAADEPLTKGDKALIVDFDPEQNLYLVQRADTGA
jgi:hypothetical protein